MSNKNVSIAVGERWFNRNGDAMRVTSSDTHGYWVAFELNRSNGYAVTVHGEYLDNDSERDHALDLIKFIGTQGVQPAQVTLEEVHLPTTVVDMNEPGYELLASVLQRAYDQAAKGKGKERHASNDAFENQVMQDGARRFGVGALLFQAFKKSEESQRLPVDRGVAELLGAIVYLAGAVIRREADGV